MGNVVGSITGRCLQAKKDLRMAEISHDDIMLADTNCQEGEEPQLDLFEFTRFILARYDIAKVEILDGIKKNFDDLDVDKSGHLDAMDVLKRTEKKKQHH